VSDEEELGLLRRQITETLELLSSSMASIAALNVRLDALSTVVANLEQRFRQARVRSTTRSELEW
jgi:hypothetical protein